MSTILAEVDNPTILERLAALFFLVRMFLGFLPALIAWFRHHPRRWWIWLLTVLGLAYGPSGWATYLVGYIYFTLRGFELRHAGELAWAAVPELGTTLEVWVPLAWSAIIWLIAMVWATRKIEVTQ